MSSDDTSWLDEDDEYRERMREKLDETEYDTELGMEMSRDAQRLVAGEISEEEFRDKYHEAVIEEFDEDNRGLDSLVDESETEIEEDASVQEKMSALVEDGDYDRREVMKKGGAAAAAVGVGLSGSKGGSDGEDGGGHGRGNPQDTGGGPEDKQWGMVINLNNCTGCLDCVVACKDFHGTSKGAHWIYVMAYEEEGRDDHEDFFVRPCMHCDEAPCKKVCPVGARHTRQKDGLVLTDYEICIGCRYCQVSCPYGANHFQWGEPDTNPQDAAVPRRDERGQLVDGPQPQGVMGKCTFEPVWQDKPEDHQLHGTTMCEQACGERNAIHFGDMNDPESDPNQHLKEYKEAHENDLSQENFEDRKPHTVSTFRPMEDKGTDPNVKMIGNQPGSYAEQLDPNDEEEVPVTYEERGLIDDRKSEVLDKGAAANKDGESA